MGTGLSPPAAWVKAAPLQAPGLRHERLTDRGKAQRFSNLAAGPAAQADPHRPPPRCLSLATGAEAIGVHLRPYATLHTRVDACAINTP